MSRTILLFVAACGSSDDLCQKYADEFEACEGDDYSVEQCEADLADCDAKDRDLLDDFYGCAKDEGLMECDGDTSETNLTDMIDAILGCAEPLGDVSEDCQGDFLF